MSIAVPLALGIALRSALFAFPSVVETLGDRLELSSALTRFVDVEQEVRWPSAEGAHRPPILTHLVRLGAFTPTVFVAIDIGVALLIHLSLKLHERHQVSVRQKENELLAKWNELGRPRLGSSTDDIVVGAETAADTDITWAATKQTEEIIGLTSQDLPVTIATVYLLAPFTILTCGARSFAPLSFLLALGSIVSSQLQIPPLSGALLGLTVFVEGPAYIAILGLPVLAGCSRSLAPRILAVVSFVATLSVALYLSYLLEGRSWRFIEPVYLWVYSAPDFRPNVGMWWYLLAEMFERYRAYFLFLLHSLIYLLATPLSIYLHRRPVLHAHFGLAVWHLFQPYPEIFHEFTALLLMLMHPQFALSISLLGATLLVTCFSLVLQPIMLYTWLDLGSGNANYYYFQCLIVNGSLAMLLLQFFMAVVARDMVMTRIRRFLDKNAKVD